MALIKCPECGRMISDKAAKCLGCGISMEMINELHFKEAEIHLEEINESGKTDNIINNKNVERIPDKEENLKTKATIKANKVQLLFALVIACAFILLFLFLLLINGFINESGVTSSIYEVSGLCLSHDFKEATCTESKTCRICGKKKGEPNGHQYEIFETIEPSCENEGKNVLQCSVCNDSYGEAVSATGHLYNISNQIAPGCVEDGSTVYTCNKCDNVYSEIINRLEHDWNEETCTMPKTCKRCLETEGSALGHTTLSGVCERCGEEVHEPVVFNGRGASVLQNVNIPDGMYKIYMKNVGSSNFIITVYDDNGDRIDGWANEIGNYSGYIIFTGSLSDGTIEVRSKGEWTIEIQVMEDGGTSNIRGTGDCVTPAFELKPGALVVNLAYKGPSNFIVNVYDEFGNRKGNIANVIGNYEGETVFNKASEGQKYYLEVMASGTWSIDFGLGDEITTVSNTK